VPGRVAFVFGWFAFRARVTGVYLSIIAQGLTYATMLAFFRNDLGFGGKNGLTDFRDLLGFNLRSDRMRVALLWASAVALIAALAFCRLMVTSRLGKVLVAIRDAEARVRFLGNRAKSSKLVALVVSAVMAGVGGALYLPQVGRINPSEVPPTNSMEAVVWVAVGGRGTLAEAVVGTVAVNLRKSYCTANLRELWLFALGVLFMLVTLFLPRGTVGSLDALAARGPAARRAAATYGSSA